MTITDSNMAGGETEQATQNAASQDDIFRTAIILGEQDVATGVIREGVSHDSRTTMEIDYSKRYSACVETAEALHKQYSPTLSVLYSIKHRNPEQQARLEEIESTVANALNDRVHKEFGDYNQAVADGEHDDPSLKSDTERTGTANPLKLSELGKDALICRHYAPLANDLCTRAGMQVARLNGVMIGEHQFVSMADKNMPITVENTFGRTLEASEWSGHASVVSAATGNIIEFTENSDVYKKTVNHPTLAEIRAGKPVVFIPNADNQREMVSFIPFEAKLATLTNKDVAVIKERGLEAVKPIYADLRDQAVADLDKAVKAGDVNTARAIIERIDVPTKHKADALYTAMVERNDLPMVDLMLGTGALNQFKAVDLKEAEHNVAEWTLANKTPNPEFQKKLMPMLGVSPQEYSDMAKKAGAVAHLPIAQSMINADVKSPQQPLQSPSAAPAVTPAKEKPPEKPAENVASPPASYLSQAMQAVDSIKGMATGGVHTGSGFKVPLSSPVVADAGRASGAPAV